MTPMDVVPLDVTSFFTDAAQGSLLLAIPVVFLAGLASFLSPCVLPLLPAYLSYATGLSASEVATGEGSRRSGRMLVGMSLFVLGFAVVFVLTGALFGGIGQVLKANERIVEIIAGVVSIALGLVFADVIRFGQTQFKPVHVSRVGIAAAPLLGMAFAVGWTPCIGPTLSVVLTLSLNEGSPGKGALLAFIYTLGLGLPFIVLGLLYHRISAQMAWVKAHQRLLQRIGGIIMMVVGVLLLTGLWNRIVHSLTGWIAGFGTPI